MAVASENYEGPSNFCIDTLELRSLAHGKTLDIARLVTSFTIKESIFENCTTASFVFLDGLDLIQYFPIVGEEQVYVKFATDSTSKDVEYLFHAYKVSDKKVVNNQLMSFTMECCKPEFIKSISSRVSRSYKQMTIDNIVSDLSDNYFANEDKTLTVMSNTKNIEHIVFPYMEPLQCINLMCSLAHPESNKMATYLFFEDKDSYKFASLEDLIEQEPYRSPEKFNAVIQNLDRTKENNRIETNQGAMAITEYSFSDPAPDLIRQIGAGSRNSRTLSVDVFSKSFRTYDFDYDNEYDNMGHMDLEKIQVKGNPYKTENSKYNVIFTKSHRQELGYVQSKGADDFSAKPEESLPWRSSAMALFDTINASITIPGDSNITCGMMIECDFPNLTVVENNKSNPKDKMLSGKYLVNSVTHSIKMSTKNYTQTLNISKDTYGAPLTYDL